MINNKLTKTIPTEEGWYKFKEKNIIRVYLIKVITILLL